MSTITATEPGTYELSGRTVIVTRFGVIIEPCWKCGGDAYLRGLEYSDSGRCWGCNATGVGRTFNSIEQATKVMHTRELAQIRRAKKAAVEDAQRQAEIDARSLTHQSWVDEAITAYPLLVDLTYVDNLTWSGRNYRLPYELKDTAEVAYSLTVVGSEHATLEELAAAEAILAGVIEAANATPDVTEGRRTITGEILTVKWVENMYGGALKMLVGTDEGERLWGTKPSILSAECDKGARIQFVATVEAGGDKGFGFFARPAKAVQL